MVRNIIYYFLLFDLILACIVAVIWVSNGTQFHSIRVGSALLPFFQRIVVKANLGAWQIPQLEPVDPLRLAEVLNATEIFSFIRLLAAFISGIIPILNFIIFLLNSVIKLVFVVGAFFTELYSLGNALSNL